LLSEAQDDAEQSRSQARELLAGARAEVSALQRRRDEIAAELSQLSGVIEALAVSESDPEEQP
jgi:F0F1-type ATP synthase membrane subunit b/b'